jgi:ribonuclease J
MKTIVAVDKKWGIGRKNDLLFNIPEDMKHFREITSGKTVVMGLNTLRSFPGGKPLKNRVNIVLSNEDIESQDGLIIVVAVVSEHSSLILSGPDIVSRGFVYVRESEELMDEVRMVAADALSSALDRNGSDWYEVKNKVRDDITKFIYSKTKRKPMVLPIIMEV